MDIDLSAFSIKTRLYKKIYKFFYKIADWAMNKCIESAQKEIDELNREIAKYQKE